MPKIKIGIIGGAGYTGGELLRILVQHVAADIVFVHSQSQAGKLLSDVHGDLLGETNMRFSSTSEADADLLFLCVGHGEAKKFLENSTIRHNTKVIDLSQDHRLLSAGKPSVINGHPFVYGLPELNKRAIAGATMIANPGCFATAIQLGLLPLAKAGLLKNVYTTGITGSTGAGQGLSATSHFSWRTNNIQAYKSLNHQHVGEIQQSIGQLQPGFEQKGGVHFIPWRGDFARGIFVSSQLECSWSQEALVELYESYYHEQPFTFVSRDPIFLKQVVNTNKCVIQLEKSGDSLVIHSAIDNLLKGASGQAVQNMNLMFGLDESTGLRLKANFF